MSPIMCKVVIYTYIHIGEKERKIGSCRKVRSSQMSQAFKLASIMVKLPNLRKGKTFTSMVKSNSWLHTPKMGGG